MLWNVWRFLLSYIYLFFKLECVALCRSACIWGVEGSNVWMTLSSASWSRSSRQGRRESMKLRAEVGLEQHACARSEALILCTICSEIRYQIHCLSTVASDSYYGLFTLLDPDSDLYSDTDYCTMQKFPIDSNSDSDHLIEM